MGTNTTKTGVQIETGGTGSNHTALHLLGQNASEVTTVAWMERGHIEFGFQHYNTFNYGGFSSW
ncbi:MAG: hypothetical protein IPG92_11425 [Flavobacteriales bacterium]|nr:hypothetical protein [Flavobacteriales bacterium]